MMPPPLFDDGDKKNTWINTWWKERSKMTEIIFGNIYFKWSLIFFTLGHVPSANMEVVQTIVLPATRGPYICCTFTLLFSISWSGCESCRVWCICMPTGFVICIHMCTTCVQSVFLPAGVSTLSKWPAPLPQRHYAAADARPPSLWSGLGAPPFPWALLQSGAVSISQTN